MRSLKWKKEKTEMSGKKASQTSSKNPILASPMRPDASMTEDSDITKDRPCKCGCGRIFKPTTKHNKFFEDHRKRFWLNKNSGPIAISKIRRDHVAILARLDRIEAKIGMKGVT